jgi:arylsulfatase A-like enzyme
MPDRRRELGEIVSLAFVVCLVIFLVKTTIAYRDLDQVGLPPAVWRDGVCVSLAQVWACCAQDFAVGLGWILVGAVVLRWLRSDRGRRVVRVAAHVAAGLALCYMIANAQIFHVLRRFLTYSLFQSAGGFTPERSILAYATPTVKTTLALVPPLALALHLSWVHYLARFWSGATWLIARPAVLLAGIGALSYVTCETQRTLFLEHRGDFTENAHLLMVRSVLQRDLGFGDVGPEPPETADFEPNRPRPSGLTLAKRPTNVIVVVLECAGTVYLSHYGYPLATTPCLSKLEAEGCTLTFNRFHATANHTTASALPIFGSLWNDPYSIATIIEFPRFPIPAAASWLQQRGYQTVFLGSGGYGAWDGFRNLQQAFASNGWDVARNPNHPFWAEGGARDRFQAYDYLDKAMFADARRFLRSPGKAPFFMMLWGYEAHAPYFGPKVQPEWDQRHFPEAVRSGELADDFRRFLSALHQADALIGELYEELKAQGLADDTLVVVTADHGESFGQHGAFKHCSSLHVEELQVPLILINRHLAAALGPRSNALGSHIDLWPTITDICSLPFNKDWQGRSLLGDDDTQRRVYFSRIEALGVIEGRFKYIWDATKQRDYLYDLHADPQEGRNIAAEQPDLCLRQRRRLRDWTLYQRELTKQRLTEAARR